MHSRISSQSCEVTDGVLGSVPSRNRCGFEGASAESREAIPRAAKGETVTVSTTYKEIEARGGVVTSYKNAPTRTITAGGTTYAYRELGPKGGIPVVFFVHLAAVLDNWDPRIIDPIAKNRHVITLDSAVS